MLWAGGSVVQWFSGSVDQWISGSVDQWISGSVDQWISGSVDQWISGSVDQWISGSVDQWISGSVDQWISGSVDQWISGSVDQWISERCMYVTPIRLDLLLKTNQISCCKGKRYVRRFDPDTVENGHIYSSIKGKEVFIYWAYFDIFCGLG